MRNWRVVWKHHAPAAFSSPAFFRRRGRGVAVTLLAIALFAAAPAAAIPPNTPITNTAHATYRVGGADVSVTASDTVITDLTSGNSPPSGITLAPNRVDENAPGATIGTVTVADPDPTDTHTFAVSDPRFEIVNGILKLVAGTALDFETEPSVNVSITATDSTGASITVPVTVIVVNRNEAPTALNLAKTTLDANTNGAPVGALSVTDPDVGDTHTFAVDDPRFEVVNGVLQLVPSASLPLGATATVAVTATDAGGLSFTRSFVITATPPGSGAGTTASVRILEYAPGAADAENVDVGTTQCSASTDPLGPYQNAPTPTLLSGAPVPVPGTVAVRGASVFKTGAPLFVEVVDANANTNPAVRENVLVTLTTDGGDAEALKLVEAGVDSSTFVGYVDSNTGAPAAHDCTLSGGSRVSVTASYVDAADPADHAEARAMFDPVSRVFLASTGQPVSGASIELVDATGAPAHPLGGDGAATYPATVVSGANVVDGAGNQYVYGAGEYRYPWLAAGGYQLRVTPPHRFAFPSIASDASIQAVAGAPYALSGASRGAPFTIAVGPASRVDVPLDLLPVTPTKAALAIFALASNQAGGTNQFVGATQCQSAGGFVAAPPPVGRLGTPTVPGVVAVVATTTFGAGEPVFVVLTDPDQDLDPFAPDTIVLTAHSAGGTQTLRLTETGASTGVFTGYLQLARAATPNACALDVASGAQFTIDYRDAHDAADTVSATAVVDPGSRVFDSATGVLVDGVSITLLDAATGQPATGAVFADDGVTLFPTTVVSGAGATDASGAHIAFATGTYRFPVVNAGTYRLRVTPPQNYAFPSAVSDAALQTLTGAPFALSGGSRGAPFTVAAGTPLQIDVPVDPTTVDIFVSKQANKEVAAIGDFVQYKVIVENTGAAAAVAGATLVDELPKGFRYVADSVRIDGARAAEPTIAKNGTTVAFALPSIPAAGTVEVDYVTDISAGAGLGKAVNAARVVGTAVGSSNTASATVLVREDLLGTKAILIGQVIDGGCDDGRAKGLGGVRVLLENGTYVVTDRDGKYHVEGLDPGTHVVQLDLASLPETHEVIDCDRNTRHGGTAFSQFVDVQGGTMWRADFHVAEKPPLSSDVKLELDSSTQAERASFALALSGGAIPLGGATAVVMLPAALRYVAGSARLDGAPIEPTADSDDGALTFRIGDTNGPFARALSFAAAARDGSPNGTVKALAMFQVDGKRLRTPVVATTVAPNGPASGAANNVTVVEVTAKHALTPRRPFEIPELADAKVPTFDAAWLATQSPEPDIVWPPPDANPRTPAVWVVVKHAPGQRVALVVDGAPVDALDFDGTEVDRDRGVAVTRFRNVPIKEGDNPIVARLVDEAGETSVYGSVHFAGAPVHAALLPQHSYLIADGITPSVIAVQLTDRDGKPVRPGMTGAFDVEPPFRMLESTRSLGQSVGPKATHDTYMVRDGGIAYVELQPTTDSGRAQLKFEFDGLRTETVDARIAPAARDWVLVGFGEGTVGYNKLSGNMEALAAADVDEDLTTEGRTAFYAKGRVRGEWLATLAYDSDNHGQNSLGSQIDPNKYYTLYGDGTEQRYDAQTQSKVYVKLERPEFFALFGDFDTGFNQTELARYTRRMNGAQADYDGAHVRVQGFASQTNQGFMRDDIRGDGTSGEYHLSQGGVVVNSETIRIQVRDRFKSEVVISEQALTRYMDYTIDYDAGTLIFKQPIPYQDTLFNPVYIVAEYETGGAGAKDQVVGGGRAAYRFGNGGSEVGMTYVHDGATGSGGDLGGVDLAVALPASSTLKVEAATTDTDQHGTSNAYLAQVEHRSGDLVGRAYLREQQENFGLGQQATTEAGTRKYGAEGEYRFTETLSTRLDAFDQTNLVADVDRKVVESALVYRDGSWLADGGVRLIREDAVDGTARDANQLTFGSTRTLDDGRLKLNGIADIDLGGKEDNVDYPTRMLTGAEYKIAPGVALLGEQEFTFGDLRNTQNTSFGVKAQPWTGSSMNAALGRQDGENADRVYATTGLAQTWQVNERWRLDVGADRVQTIKKSPQADDPDALTWNPNVPLASGSIDNDFTAAFFGVGYRQADWDATSRVEFHHGDQVDKWNVLAGMSRQLDGGKVVSGSFALLEAKQSDGTKTNQGDLRFGAAWRPLDSDWAFLNRLDLIFNSNNDATFDTTTRKLVENMNANYAPTSRWQLALMLGLKYTMDDVGGEDYFGVTSLTGVEFRYDLTERWDAGVHTSVLHTFATDATNYSTGASVGYNPLKNMWVSVGYNVTGFEDRDFTGADYTAKGPFLKMRFKVDQRSMGEFLDYASFGATPPAAKR